MLPVRGRKPASDYKNVFSIALDMYAPRKGTDTPTRITIITFCAFCYNAETGANSDLKWEITPDS